MLFSCQPSGDELKFYLMGFRMLMIIAITIDEAFLEYESADTKCLTWWCGIRTSGTMTRFRGRLVDLLPEKLLTDDLASGVVKICPESIRTDDLTSGSPFQAFDREPHWRQYKEQSSHQIQFLYSSASPCVTCSQRWISTNCTNAIHQLTMN